MAFNSLHFLLFFPVVFAVAWSLRRNATARIVFLLAASYYFYMSWNPLYAGLIFGSTILDFLVGRAMYRSSSPAAKRFYLLLSLFGNLGVLLIFKYYNFFAQSFGSAASWISGGATLPLHDLLLPVGISFYTFQTLSYTIDIYRGRIAPGKSFLRFALFVSFFPQLVAGPIVRASHFLPQLDRAPRYDDSAVGSGLARILLGLIKKVCIADVLAVTLVDPVFADPSACGSGRLLLAMYGYAFQIYYDFSGYSDIAIGAARMLGFELPINFNRPYLATSLRDFWRRWHISLSTWLRDYLYVPLGGGRGSTLRTARNLAVVMLLGGLWHGAAWGFLLWGLLHGIGLGAGRLFFSRTGIDADRTDQPTVQRVARVAITFHLVATCFVMFRAPDLATFSAYFKALAAFAPAAGEIPAAGWIVLAVAAGLEWLPRGWWAPVGAVYTRLPSIGQACVVTGCLLLFAALGGMSPPFIYFQF